MQHAFECSTCSQLGWSGLTSQPRDPICYEVTTLRQNAAVSGCDGCALFVQAIDGLMGDSIAVNRIRLYLNQTIGPIDVVFELGDDSTRSFEFYTHPGILNRICSSRIKLTYVRPAINMAYIWTCKVCEY